MLSISLAPYPIELHRHWMIEFAIFRLKNGLHERNGQWLYVAERVPVHILFFFLIQCMPISIIHWILNIVRQFSSCPNRNATNDGININIGLIKPMPVRFINILNRCTLHHWNFVAPIRNTTVPDINDFTWLPVILWLLFRLLKARELHMKYKMKDRKIITI